MEEGTGVGWRSALMAPVCFVIRSSVKRRMWGGGRRTGRETGRERGEDRKRTERTEPAKRRRRRGEIRGQLRQSCRGGLLQAAERRISKHVIRD